MKGAGPWIGINTSTTRNQKGTLYYQLDARYVDAVRRAGGKPVILPFFESRAEAAETLARIDGVVFIGGDDIDPVRWGDKLHPKAKLMEKVREESDFAALAEALTADKPLLGVCLGCQELNVAAGGSLSQHIENHEGGAKHGVEIVKGTRLEGILGRRPGKVLSFHHQAIAKVGRGLVVSARADDGVIEAVEDPTKRFAVAVQWHPERMTKADELFAALVAESRR
jgi:gamma-glutamyl-gamma-aminobutyrate hydrolase PuuD